MPGAREATPAGPAPLGGLPDSPREGESSASKNRPGPPPPVSEKERVRDHPVVDDRWGDLPIHVRDLFRAQGNGDLPPRYREWIDAYYRRLNRAR